MSTRATYTLSSEYAQDVTVYIHHDGYPEGASAYYRKAFSATGADFASKFIRANERAEVTVKGSHGDIEFHYDMTKNSVKMYERKFYSKEELDMVFIKEFTKDEFIGLSL